MMMQIKMTILMMKRNEIIKMMIMMNESKWRGSWDDHGITTMTFIRIMMMMMMMLKISLLLWWWWKDNSDYIDHEGGRNDFDDAEMNSIIMIPMNMKIVICFLKITILLYLLTREFLRVVVYLGRPIVSSYMSPNAGEGWSSGVSANEYSCTQKPK